MKQSLILVCALAFVGTMAACGGKKQAEVAPEAPAYTVLELPNVDLSTYTPDADGWITLFDGTTFTGWRGYNREDVPGAWTIEDGALKIQGSGRGEAGAQNGGDLVFAHKFGNFEMELEWKVAKGSNSGIFYLAQEIEGQPIYISAPEYQVLDNEGHPDAMLGKDGNRKSASLYDMIPANPQNAKPAGEWNKAKIVSFKGTVVHFQNDEQVLEYHLWTDAWKALLQESKFKEGSTDFPLAFGLLSDCGGPEHKGYIGLQDHGDDVWFRNIRIKILD
jgi:hypothetical protein